MTAPLAVVTGATSGIGFGLAREFARHGHDLVVIAEDDVEHAARLLRGTGRVVHAVTADLREREQVMRAWRDIADLNRSVDVLALNAGVGRGDAFADQPVGDVLSVVDLNVASTVHLARLALPGMLARDRGRILLTSSLASLMPGPYQAVYNASKSFVQSLALGLQAEVAGTGVTVTSLMPGPTATHFFDRAEMSEDTLIGRGPKDDADTVARQGYEATMAGRRRVVGGGLATRGQYLAGLLLPDAAKAAAHAVMARPRR